MKTAVIYQSKYGSTETYAKWLSEDLGADLLVANQVKLDDLQPYDTIVYGGGLYAGSVNGVALLTKNAERIQDKSIYLFIVGASDMTSPEIVSSIRSSLKQTLPPTLLAQAHIYHLRGGMRYSKMSFVHRTMMHMMIKMLRKKPEQELRADEKGMLETYGQDIDFTDRTAIAPLVADIRAGA